MHKRQRVPAALHSELTEYSSLIRALRASGSLDVTTHLARRASCSKPDSHDSDSKEIQHETNDAEDEYDTDTMTSVYPPTSSALPSRDVSPSRQSRSSSIEISRNRKRKRLSSTTRRRRDAWTRWPLLVDDIHVPEWNFEDEIGYLAEHVLNHQSRTLLPSHEAEKDDGNHGDLGPEDIDDVDPSCLPHLTEAASNYLSTILALLVAHTPNRPDSQQNRVEPMGWRAVLDVLSSSGDPNVADPKMLSSVKMRMESLYTRETNEEPEPHSLVAHRIQRSLSAKQKLREELSSSLDSFLKFPETPEGWTPPLPSRISVKKVRKARVKTPAYVEDDREDLETPS